MDFIPLSNKRKSNQNSNSKRSNSFVRDAKLIQRVRDYLKTKGEQMIDIEEMAIHLHRQFREYNRKKKNPFYIEVEKAFNAIANESKKDEKCISSPEFSSDNENYVQVTDNNLVNTSLQILYAKNKEENAKVEDNDVLFVEDKGRKRKSEKIDVKSDELVKKSKKSKMDGIQVRRSDVTFKDMGGCESTIVNICDLIFHLNNPELHVKLGIEPPRGLLLYGPPGCGKTMLANAIAGELDFPIIQVGSTELVTGISGGAEKNIRDLFEKAVAHAPCVLFIDEIDAVFRKRESAQKEMETRIITQLVLCMNDLNTIHKESQVFVIGTANYPDSIDPSLRCSFRFDLEVNVPIPDEAARTKILHVLCTKIRLDAKVDLQILARQTPGFVAADLKQLITSAGSSAFKRIWNSHSQRKDEMEPKDLQTQLEDAIARIKPQSLPAEKIENLFITSDDFQIALKTVQPSLKREGFSTVPDVTWDDVGALEEVQEELRLSILSTIHQSEICKTLGTHSAAGILLYGPPGCGKTLAAKAIANESGLNFISIKGPELLNKYVGESEHNIRRCFQLATNSSPCVIFFDEFDALCPKRSTNSNNDIGSRLVNQLLTEIDGFVKREKVFVIGATNRPDNMDPAILRSGRLGTLIHVGLPTPKGRVEILRKITKNGTLPPLADDVDLESIANDCDGFTGADLMQLVERARYSFLKEIGQVVKANVLVELRHFQMAFTKIRKSVSTQDQRMYDDIRKRLESNGV